MSKATQRSGHANLIGANNPKVTQSAIAPNSPKSKDIWIDTASQGQYYYDGSEWQLMSIVDQSNNTRLKTWTGNETAYAAIGSKDVLTIYIVYPD